MSTYATYDLSESLDIARSREGANISREDIETVHYAWGYSPEGYGSWEGGFILELKDGRFATLTGWCDTTGWGCQDGVEVEYHLSLPDAPTDLCSASWASPPNTPVIADHLPADLNRWVKGDFDLPY
jgi:hypothetical protein